MPYSTVQTNATLVIVLEEDNIRRNLIATELRNAGFLVVTECNGEQALQAIERDQPKVLVMPLFLSSYDLVQFVVRVRSQFASLPIVCTYDSNSNQKDISLQSSLVKKLGIFSVVDASNADTRLLVESVDRCLSSNCVDYGQLDKMLAD